MWQGIKMSVIPEQLMQYFLKPHEPKLKAYTIHILFDLKPTVVMYRGKIMSIVSFYKYLQYAVKPPCTCWFDSCNQIKTKNKVIFCIFFKIWF